MLSWGWAIFVALALVVAGVLYIHLRWRRSPQAYRAMMGLAACYFVAGSIGGAWILHMTAANPTVRPAVPSSVAASSVTPAARAPTLKPNYTGPSVRIPPLHYDPAHAILPDSKLAPGETFPSVTAADVCTPGWPREHRDVTESMRDRVYAEYGRVRGPSCCEVDHLIPLELGGSNDIRNLWPQPDDPRPGDAEKDQLENELHHLVCADKLSLADAQKCIASNWVACWEKYVVPEYGPQWAAANRHGW
jgi:hypothetical protein